VCIHFQVHESASAGRPASVGSLAVAWESAYRWAVVVTDLVLIAVCLRVGLVLTDLESWSPRWT